MTTRPSEESGELMYIRCAQCGHWMDVKPGAMNKISHGLCDACFHAAMRGLDGDPRATRDGADSS